MYKYGEEISYSFELVGVGDYDSLQLFECTNERLDRHIREDIIQNNVVMNEDGLYFKFVDTYRDKIISIVSLASSGIIYKVDNYTHVLPAIKIDVLAVDKEYQKLHYYFSDEIIGVVISHCRKISEEYALADYVILYADKKAYRYYERNGFLDYSEFMIRENNQEVSKNIPMYLEL